jgi:hypothetical protein
MDMITLNGLRDLTSYFPFSVSEESNENRYTTAETVINVGTDSLGSKLLLWFYTYVYI